MTAITALPPAPLATDSVENFDAKAFALVAALANFVSQTNTVAGEVQTNADLTAALLLAAALPGYSDTSTTSLSIGLGTKVFTVTAGKSWLAGQVVVAVNGANYMKGTVSSYVGTALTLNVTEIVGSGTFAAWSIALSYNSIPGLAASGANRDIISLGNNTSTVYTTAGTPTAYTITPNPALSAYSIGQSFVVNFHAASGNSPTLQISGVSVPPNLVRYNSAGALTNIAAGDLPSSFTSRVTLLSATQALVEEMPPFAQQAGEVCFFAQNTAPTGFLKANGAAVSRTTYSALFAALVKSSAVTMTVSAPCIITWNGHGRSTNDPVKFTTTGALPTGLTAGTTYYVVGASITANTFNVSAAPGGAAIGTSGTQSGTHTAIHAPFGDGDGSTTFALPDLRGEFLRGWDDGRAVDSNRAFGIAQAQDTQPHTHAQTGIVGTGGSITGISIVNNLLNVGYSNYNATASFGGTETRPRNIALLACIKF